MLLSMAKDIRVILIKLADRLHNMRTLGFLPRDKQTRIGQETLDIYAPLAHRLGMGRVKSELEDLAFKHLNSEVYQSVLRGVSVGQENRQEILDGVIKLLKDELGKAELEGEVTGRAKHNYSIYRKMSDQNRPLEEIYDLMAIRIIVRSVKDCYHVLGIVHSLWTPVPDRFFDYIATPKSNLYQSLHTTVHLPAGHKLEVQIRTWDMHRTAEYGIAAHWLYKEGRQNLKDSDRQMAWLREVLEWQKDLTSPLEFMESLKIELFPEDIFVYTPKGELKQLPKGSTPLDFAFAVHSDIGFACSGGTVNGRLVPLNTPLRSGDTVEVTTSSHQKPSRDWLKLAKTVRARNKIKQWLKKKGLGESTQLGREILERELKKNRITIPSEADLGQLAQRLNHPDWQSVLAAIGNGDISASGVISRLLPESAPGKHGSIVHKLVSKVPIRTGGIKVQGLGQMMFRFAQCCQPLPGERIIGFITRGRGISVHHKDCPNALEIVQDPSRAVEVEWDVPRGHSFLVKLELIVEDRKNLLRDITEAISDSDTNIRSLDLSSQGTTASGNLILEISSLSHLNKVLRKMRKIRGVISAERAKGSQID
jgi:GTP pyrophosphokinase